MEKILGKLNDALEKAGLTDRLSPPAAPEAVAEWEREHNAVLPAEIKGFLRFSNGFEYGMNFMVFPLSRIKVINNWVGVPDGWLHIGQLIGDGCYIVSDEKGRLARYDTEARPLLSDLDLEKWIEDHVLEELYEDYDIDE